MFLTPIRGCDIFRKATRGRRFLDVAKMTSQRTSATRYFALRHRHVPRPAAQNVVQTWPKKRTARTRGCSRFRKATPERRFFDVERRVQKPLQFSSEKHTPVYQSVLRWPKTCTKIDHPDRVRTRTACSKTAANFIRKTHPGVPIRAKVVKNAHPKRPP